MIKSISEIVAEVSEKLEEMESSGYVCLWQGKSCLDGYFTANELRRIADAMDKIDKLHEESMQEIDLSKFVPVRLFEVIKNLDPKLPFNSLDSKCLEIGIKKSELKQICLNGEGITKELLEKVSEALHMPIGFFLFMPEDGKKYASEKEIEEVWQ